MCTQRSLVSRRVQPRLLWLLAIALLLGSSLTQPAYAIERGPLNKALLATVQVVVPIANEDDVYSTGSGTVLSEDGLILTNYHVMGETETGELYNANGFAGIAINPTDLRSAPVLKYAARLIAGDPNLDLALLQIDGLLEDLSAPLPDNLGLTAIDVGNTDLLEIGDEVNAFGFPGIGGDTVTFTNGKLSGFLDEDKDGVSEWIKVDLNINHGNSGGLATNALGEMIGVPTAGRTDLGMIGLVRDGNLAMQFVKRALLETSTGSTSTPGGSSVSNVQFAKAIDSRGRAQRPAVQFDSGLDSIYATFDYKNFADNGNFEFNWYQDGFRIFQDSVVWTFGSDGSTWVSVFDENGLGDGFYELEIKFNGTQIFRDGVLVGESQSSGGGSFGAITFAEGVTEGGEPINPGDSFGNVGEVYAFFDVEGVENGTSWARRWYLDGEVISEQQSVWNLGELDYTWISLYSDGGLPPGSYQLELLINDSMVQSASMEISEGSATLPGSEEGVIVTGTVSEANNRRRMVEGAAVYFLNPGTTTDDFLDDPQDSAIYASGVSDADGFYQLNRNLIPGDSYGVVAYKEGYRVVEVDDYQIDIDATSPWGIDITLERR